jgi:hypothetical protein
MYYYITHYFIHFYFITVFELFFYIYYIYPYEKEVLINAINSSNIQSYINNDKFDYEPNILEFNITKNLLNTCDNIIKTDTNKINYENNKLLNICYLYIYIINACVFMLFLYDLYDYLLLQILRSLPLHISCQYRIERAFHVL